MFRATHLPVSRRHVTQTKENCWWLWNVNIGVVLIYSNTDLIPRLWRYFGFVRLLHSFLSSSSDGLLRLVSDQAYFKPLSADTAAFSYFAHLIFLLYFECPFSLFAFVLPLHLAWTYNIPNLTYEAHCFLATLKSNDNLHYKVSLFNWGS